MAVWATAALRGVDLGDERREARLVKLVEALSEGLGCSVPEALGDAAAVKAAYRFWSSEAVSPAAIREALAASTVARSEGLEWVLAVEDTTTLDYSQHRATEGLGPVGDMRGRGLFLHTTLAVREDGVPLGVVAQHQWARGAAPTKGLTRAQRAALPTAEKESQRWLDAEAQTLARLAEPRRVVTVADREGDFYDWFAQPRRAGAELLVRVAQGHRKVEVEGRVARLAEAVAATAAVATEALVIPRQDGSPERTATVELRLLEVTVPPPAGPSQAEQRVRLEGLRMWAVAVDETAPPQVVPPVRWLLLTTVDPAEVGETPAAAARRFLAWYRRRWLVERFHYVLKQGCRVERLQLATAARLERALVTFSAVAWGVLWVTLQAREAPEAPCTVAFGELEWRALRAFGEPQAAAPVAPPPLRDMVRAVAKLGGFLGRRHDGEPGPQAVWRGLTRLHDIVACWLCFGPGARCG